MKMGGHRRSAVARVVERAVLLQLAAAATALVSCGHAPTTGETADSGRGADASTDGASNGGDAESGSPDDAESDASDAGDDAADAASDAPVLPPCTVVPDAGMMPPECPQFCSIIDPSGAQPYGQLQCEYSCVPGRRPAGLRAARACRARGAVAATLAQMAHLEAASVTAFERLARELEAHGAPVSLRRRALRAAADERRHARAMRELAERGGGAVRTPRVPELRVRSLEAIARENAAEGCVNETFSAAVAAMQGARAADASVRAKMQRIARDELRHAELAWSVARWIEPRLDRVSRARVARARAKAARELLDGTARTVAPELVSVLGLPTSAQARAIAENLNRGLWSRA